MNKSGKRINQRMGAWPFENIDGEMQKEDEV